MSQMLNVPIRSDKFSLQIEMEPVHRLKTEFQTIDIVDSVCFGRMLLLDGHIQLTELDEHAYHEALVHVPLLNCPTRRRALVVGGGDGGVIRELCRHDSIEHIDMVEIDAGVIEACRTYMPFVSGGAFDDPRVHLHVADAFPFVKQEQSPYDLIVVDSTDTYEDEEGEISEMLFTRGFYEDLKRLLTPGGFVVTQSDNPVFCPYSQDEILATLGAVFTQTLAYQAVIPSFGGVSGYVAATETGSLAQDMPPHQLDLHYLTPAAYAFAFATTALTAMPETQPC